jgi:hypothetical protein
VVLIAPLCFRLQEITTPALGAPPLLNQEGSFKNSPPQMRRGGALSAGVVLNRGLRGGDSDSWLLAPDFLFQWKVL